MLVDSLNVQLNQVDGGLPDVPITSFSLCLSDSRLELHVSQYLYVLSESHI